MIKKFTTARSLGVRRWEVARITSTFLGVEAHGIFTAILSLDYGGSGQNAGNYNLRGPECAPFLQGILRACGVDKWEDVRGRVVMVLIEDGLVKGLKPLKRGEEFIFSSVFE